MANVFKILESWKRPDVERREREAELMRVLELGRSLRQDTPTPLHINPENPAEPPKSRDTTWLDIVRPRGK